MSLPARTRPWKNRNIVARHFRQSHVFVALVTAVLTWRMTTTTTTTPQQTTAMMMTTNAPPPPPPASSSSSSSSSFSLAIIWPQKSQGFPCLSVESGTKLMERTPLRHGFLFQRPMKVGSTSFVGVVLRLAHNKGGVPFCAHRAMHGSSIAMEFHQRDREKSFLMSLVRDPTSRAVSEFFHFVVSNGQVDPTDQNFQRHLLAPKFRPYASPSFFENRYLLDLTCRNYTNGKTEAELDTILLQQLDISQQQLDNAIASRPADQDVEAAHIHAERLTLHQFGPHPINYKRIVDDILKDYDFIAVTERMDESLVVLSILLDLSLHDILYVKHPRASGGWGTHSTARPCVYVTPSFVSPGMKNFFLDSTWQSMIAGDKLLHQAANASLEATIQHLGRPQFDRRLQQYRYMLGQATQFCHDHHLIRPACDAGGQKIPKAENTCYIWGEACDHVCLDDDRVRKLTSEAAL